MSRWPITLSVEQARVREDRARQWASLLPPLLRLLAERRAERWRDTRLEAEARELRRSAPSWAGVRNRA